MIVPLENEWVWTQKNSYLSGENIEISFMNKEDENVTPPDPFQNWDIERYEDDDCVRVQIYPPDEVPILILPPPFEPNEVSSYTWDQQVYEGTWDNYTSR